MTNKVNKRIKRLFDFVLSVFLLPILVFPILLLALIATIDFRVWGIYSQKRVGEKGKLFHIYKIRTLKKGEHELGSIGKNASAFGRWARRNKLNELPQIFNVLIGNMSFVGPRPDIIGFADKLEGEDKIILDVKPGITGPATLKYRNEEELLFKQDNPDNYNKTIIWPDKVKINKEYIYNWSFALDVKYIIKSIFNY